VRYWLGDRRALIRIAQWLVAPAAITALAGVAVATDKPAAPSWTGLYVGGHFGYGTGTFGNGTQPLLGQTLVLPPSVTGFTGGYQLGYDVELPNRIVLGLGAEITFASPPEPNQPIRPFTSSIDTIAMMRPRVGYALGTFLPYLTGGLAWARTQVDLYAPDGFLTGDKHATHVGWTVGGGLEFALTGPWTARVAYDYVDLGARDFVLDSVPAAVTVAPQLHLTTIGLNYRLDPIGPEKVSRSTGSTSDDWSIHGQTTFIAQGYPDFRSPYQGFFSLPGRGETRETWTMTAFIGRRLWEGAEVYFNPELAQGSGLNGTLGIAGFPNGEAQKTGAEFPLVRPQRYLLRQTIGFGGEQESVPDGPNQVAGKRDIDRVTVSIGRFSVVDIFDANTYAHDPRIDFMNWSIWASTAYDFPANLPGYTHGAVIELNRKDWAIRAGAFQVPEAPASDILTFKTGGAVVEFEERHTWLAQPGAVRIGLFGNRGHTGNFREVLARVAADPNTNINDAMVANRRQRPKLGIYGNVEQAISRDIGVFARGSWSDGKNESLSFTDVDRSIAGGLSIKGTRWRRPNDTVGLAVAMNAISSGRRDYLGAGGLGLLIGDGRLDYREEKILEAYYALGLTSSSALTLDYQFIDNPAYNADRGPVSIFTARLHAEF